VQRAGSALPRNANIKQANTLC